jgi:transcription termination/antitermination protein NusG
MAKQTLQLGRRWYVLHTYSGYEENVKHNLEQRIESFDMQDKIFGVLVPKEKKIKIKNSKRTTVEEKIFPGYILVEMIVTDDSWYVVRNTPNVTGFVGSGTTPTPIDQKEVDSLQKRMGVEDPTHKIDVEINDPIRIIDGPFKNFEGKVESVDENRGKVKVLVSMFGRETPVELDALQIKKI